MKPRSAFRKGPNRLRESTGTESPAIAEQLMEEVCERENCKQALKRVKANKGSAGVDGMTVQQLPGYLKQHWPAIREQLLSGACKPQPVRRVEIPKPDGGVRKLGIPTVLKLKVNEQKSAVARPWERKFLGFSFTANREPKRRIAPKAVLRFKAKVRELTQRTRGVKVERMAEELGRYLRGWIGYFGQTQTPSVLQSLEEWTRRRLRSVIWKQWKRGSVRFAELRKRGVNYDLAARTAGSAHGPWRLADSPGLHFALPNAYFDSLGIPRLTGGR
ncbi:MAG TPA: group II intron maturase-specific domain-containing protein [Bryobacteraceae bacterium]|nr:group II intron maturase-specific domain-containing protein [Bryobacteraceae bacterium]